MPETAWNSENYASCLNEQAAAVRAVLEKWHTARAMTERRQAQKTPTETRAPVRPAGGRQPS